MKMKQVLCVILFVAIAEMVDLQSLQAQYYFERDSASYVRVDDDFVVQAIGFVDYALEDIDVGVSNTGDQPVIASSTTSASAVTDVSAVTAASNTQMTFNPDLVANGQVSALAMNSVIASLGGGSFALFAGVKSTGPQWPASFSKATCDAKFILRNDQINPASTQIKLKIKQSSSYAADPAFNWEPEHSFSIYKNGNPTPMLTSAASGEVTFVDPVANPGDYYVIKGVVNAKGGVSYGLYEISNIVPVLGSLSVTGEAEVSVVP